YSERYEHVNEFHLHELTRDGFKDLLSTYFENTQYFEQNFDIISTIIPVDYSGLTDLRLINWQNTNRPKKGKYLIAVASDKTFEGTPIASVVLETDKDYFKQIDRILELQDEVEKLSKWGLTLDAQRIQHETIINTLKEQLQHTNKEEIQQLGLKIEAVQQSLTGMSREKQEYIDSFNKRAEQDQQSIKGLEAQLEEVNLQKIKVEELLIKQLAESSSLEELLKKYAADVGVLAERNSALEAEQANYLGTQKLLGIKNEELANQLSSITSQAKEKEKLHQDLQFNFNLSQQQLISMDQQLATIYHSDGWKVLNRYYNLKGKYLNENSLHYKLLRRTLNFLRGRKQVGSSSASTQGAEKNKGTDFLSEDGIVDEGQIPIRSLPYFAQPVVSIIVPVYNGWEVNEKCIISILANTTDTSYEVIIADDCSTDPTRNIEKYFQNIIHVRNEKNLGFLMNCNNASGYAKGKYLHILNNDTEVRPGWLSSLVMLMEKDESIGLAGSKLIYPDGRLQEAGGIIWNDASGWNYGHSKDPEMPEFNYVKEADYVSGASIMVRADLWKELGGFDPNYSPAYCEDSDLAFTIREKGFKVMYQPLSEVIHYEGYSHGTDNNESPISGIKKYQQINNKKFFEKWKTILQRDQFPNAENIFWAKDRSRFKKTILVIDHYVPHFDKDAGSRTIFQYLKLFVALGYNVKFIGDNFFRHEPYTTVLQQMGIEVLYGPWFGNNWQEWIRTNHDKFDFILLSRPHISMKYIDFIKENTSAKILYYGHDLHFMRLLKQYEIEKKKEILESAKKWKEDEMSLYNKMDVVLAPSTDERDLIRGLGVNSNVLAIKPYIFDTIPDPIFNFSERKDILFIGGFTHTPNVDAVLWFVREVWPLVKQKIADARFIVAGSNAPAEIIALAASDIDIVGFVSEAALQKLYGEIKMVVIPLRYGAGVKGKTVEALCNGIPLVSTEFGTEGLPGDTSFLVPMKNAVDFANEVTRLYNASNDELSLLSKKEVDYIHDHFHFDVVKSEMLAILDMMAGKKKRESEAVK
ncbi:MAG: glycosyltransferase, partial [Chitinophagaceae bacterium]